MNKKENTVKIKDLDKIIDNFNKTKPNKRIQFEFIDHLWSLKDLLPAKNKPKNTKE